jgi:hypothetical protein
MCRTSRNALSRALSGTNAFNDVIFGDLTVMWSETQKKIGGEIPLLVNHLYSMAAIILAMRPLGD